MIRTGNLVLADPLLDLWRVALDPTEDRGWIDRDTALLHHFGEIAIADPILGVPAHAQQDDLNWKAAALEQRHRAAPHIPAFVTPLKLMQRSLGQKPARLTGFVRQVAPGEMDLMRINRPRNRMGPEKR
jgi:hypothetical protein